MIVGSDGRGPVPDAPPAMVVRRYDGFPSDGVHGSGEMIVYDILFMGRVEYAISGEWLTPIKKS
jgi:hypothetical protein